MTLTRARDLLVPSAARDDQPTAGDGFVAGMAAAGAMAGLMYAVKRAGGERRLMFLDLERQLAGRHGSAADHAAGFAGVTLAGALWGVLLAKLFDRPTAAKGAAFGVLPTLVVWLVIDPLMGKGLFGGFKAKEIVEPLVLNSLVWGPLAGWLAADRQR